MEVYKLLYVVQRLHYKGLILTTANPAILAHIVKIWQLANIGLFNFLIQSGALFSCVLHHYSLPFLHTTKNVFIICC